MPTQNATKPPIPSWAWIFAATCFVIPVFTVGGAIPTAIGVFAGLGVIGIARQTGKPTKSKVVMCSVVTGSAWTVFLVFLFALTALQAKHPKLNPRAKAPHQAQAPPTATFSSHEVENSAAQPEETELTSEKRLDIYQMAIRMRYHIDSAKEQRSHLKAKGFDTSHLDEMIDRRKERELDHFEFVKKFHKIDHEQLREIIAEGDRYNWPSK